MYICDDEFIGNQISIAEIKDENIAEKLKVEKDVERSKKNAEVSWKNSMRNISFFGFFTPFLALMPNIKGCETLRKPFCRLQGKERSLRLAAAHIEDALTGRGKYGKARAYFKPYIGQRCFYIYSNLLYARFVLVVIVMHALLIFFEPPSTEQSKMNPIVYILNFFCLLIFMFDLSIHIKFLDWSIFWSRETEESYWNGVQFVLGLMFIVDFLLLIAGHFANTYLYPPFRCFRLVMVLCKGKNIRHIFHVLLNILSRIIKVFIIILAFIVLFGCVGVHWFMDIYNQVYYVVDYTAGNNTRPCCVQSDEESTFIGAFDNILIAMLRLFVLLSTENYPTFMFPAYRHNRLNFFFFGVFVFVGVFFLTAILLAVVVDSYWLDAKKHVKKSRTRERTELAKAWNLIDPCGVGTIDVYDEKLLELFRLLKPKHTDEQNLILIGLIDGNQDGFIDSFEWTTTLRQALEAEFEEDVDDFTEQANKPLNTYKQIGDKARKLIESETFSRLILILIFFHIFLFTLRWKGQSKTTALVIQGFRSAILLLFMIESVIKIIGLGKRLLRQMELTDVILVLSSTLLNISCFIYMDTRLHDLFTILSSLCVFLRLFLNSAQARGAFRWFMNIVPVMMDLMILLIISLYFSAVIGLELFQNYPVTKETIGSTYSSHCGIGFDTFSCSLLMLFQMLSTSNWHDVMNSIRQNTGRQWTAGYFVIVYVVITMVIMNLFVAIAIEAANKIGRSHNDYNPVNTKKQDQKMKKKSLKQKANSAIDKLAMFFVTTRSEDISQRNEIVKALTQSAFTGVKRKRGSTTLILKQPIGRSKKISVLKVPSPMLDALKAENKHDGIVENNISVEPSRRASHDRPTLTAKERRQEKLKRRIRERRERHLKKRIEEEMEIANQLEKEQKYPRHVHDVALENTKSLGRVIASFKATDAAQLPVKAGDIINVLERADGWVRGEVGGSIGWIPASHVLITTSRFTNGLSSKDPRMDEEQNFPSCSNSQWHRGSVSENLGNSKHKIKIKRAGDWTRDILGEITIMNAEEMRELNKVMKAEMRAPTSSFQLQQRPRAISGISLDSIATDSEYSVASTRNLWSSQPKVKLLDRIPSRPTNQRLPQNKNTPLRVFVDSVKTLTPSPPSTPTPDEVIRLVPDNVKNKTKVTNAGTPPDWLKQFALTNNVSIDEDQRLSVESVSRGSTPNIVTPTTPLTPASLKRRRTPLPLRSLLLKVAERRRKLSSNVSPLNDISCANQTENDIQVTDDVGRGHLSLSSITNLNEKSETSSSNKLNEKEKTIKDLSVENISSDESEKELRRDFLKTEGAQRERIRLVSITRTQEEI